jgi:hypothetical protein
LQGKRPVLAAALAIQIKHESAYCPLCSSFAGALSFLGGAACFSGFGALALGELSFGALSLALGALSLGALA